MVSEGCSDRRRESERSGVKEYCCKQEMSRSVILAVVMIVPDAPVHHLVSWLALSALSDGLRLR